MLVEVLVNETFKDKYNPKKKFEAGKKYMLTTERVKEIKEVKPTLVTEIAVISDTEDEVQVPNEEPAEDSKKEPAEDSKKEPVEDSKKEQKK